MFGFKRRAEAWRQKKREEYQRRGYDYAAGRLLKGADPDHLKNESDSMEWRGSFDKGMDKAIRDWEEFVTRRMK